MWRIIITLAILLGAPTTLSTPTGSVTRERVSDRSLRIGGSSNVPTASDTSSNGFSVSFVPLFSLLANFIPRILSRFNGVNAYKARSLENSSGNTQSYDEHGDKFCNLKHLGKWPDATNCRQFYVCELSSNCNIPTTGNEVLTQPHGKQDTGEFVQIGTISTSCTNLKVFQCKAATMYNPSTQKCESEANSTIVCEQR